VPTITKSRLIKNSITACLMGLAYAAATSVSPAGFLNAALIFTVLGVLYTIATQSLSDNFNGPTKSNREYFYLVIRAAIIFLGLASTMLLLSWAGGWKLLYSIFHWQEKDPMGPAFNSMAFGITIPIITILWGARVISRSKKE